MTPTVHRIFIRESRHLYERGSSHVPVLRTAFPLLPALVSISEEIIRGVMTVGEWTLPVEAFGTKRFSSPEIQLKNRSVAV